ncbi:MAG: hypothetical protein R3B72_51925 [Polyangiaceae bacterium]
MRIAAPPTGSRRRRRHTGIRPAIVASHEARRLWVLGQSTLGLETGLMAALPDGAILPDPSAAPVVGQITVGQAEPRPKAEFGAPLFSDTAHLFSVIVPAGAIADNAQFDLLRDVVAAEKPAHTDAHVCAIEPMMRVGFQARIGVDSIVAGPPAPMVLESRLGLYTTLGDDPEAPARVGRATIGESFSLGRATTHATGLVHRKTIGDIT